MGMLRNLIIVGAGIAFMPSPPPGEGGQDTCARSGALCLYGSGSRNRGRSAIILPAQPQCLCNGRRPGTNRGRQGKIFGQADLRMGKPLIRTTTASGSPG